MTILLEADIALLSNSDFAILISFHSCGVTPELFFVKYYVAVYWVITGQYCELWLEVNNLFFTCSVFHSSAICLSIYLGNRCSGKLNILSIEFQIREVVFWLSLLKAQNFWLLCQRIAKSLVSVFASCSMSWPSRMGQMDQQL